MPTPHDQPLTRRARIEAEKKPEQWHRPRARVVARPARPLPIARPRPAVDWMRGTLGSLGALALVATYLLPSYAASTTDTVTSAPAALGQSLIVPESGIADDSARDTYLITKTVEGGYEEYAHLDSTFANNPNSIFRWPFDVGVPISSGFGYRNCSGCSSNHQGIDMNPGIGTPIKSIGPGTVKFVGTNPYESFGIYVILEHEYNGQVFTSLYAHMIEGSSPLVVGDSIAAGDLVGQVGNTGQSTGAHLHLGIYVDGVAIDPYPFLKEIVGS